MIHWRFCPDGDTGVLVRIRDDTFDGEDLRRLGQFNFRTLVHRGAFIRIDAIDC